MSSHPDFIVGFNYSVDGLANELLTSSHRGDFFIDLAKDLSWQADGDKLSGKVKLPRNLYFASKNIYVVGYLLNIEDVSFNLSDSNVYSSKLIRSVGNMTYDKISDIINIFDVGVKSFLIEKSYLSIIKNLSLAKVHLDEAWRISKPYTTIISKDNINFLPNH